MSKLEVRYIENTLEIIINDDCHLKEFNDEIRIKVKKDFLSNLSLAFIEPDFSIKKGTIYLFMKDNLVFNVYTNEQKTYISERKFIETGIQETIINLEENNKFSISSMNHDLNGSTHEIRTYMSNTKSFSQLDKNIAFDLARQLLEHLNEVLTVDNIYEQLKILPQYKYNPIISDEIITLSLCDKALVETINNKKSQTLDIILNETKEKVGSIHFDYSLDVNSKNSVGNVSYEIFEQFQNKRYATRALKLLIEIVKNNKYEGNKDLYFWICCDNEASKKVVLNNGGHLVNKENNEIDNQASTYRIKI